MSTLVIGVDPGLTTGLMALRFNDYRLAAEPIAVQIHGPAGVLPFIYSLLAKPESERQPALVAVEQFVVGGRAVRSRYPNAGKVTRELIAAVQDLEHRAGIGHVQTRPAALVKPWATDHRLEAAGLLDCCAGMGHARDAARHALYAAVNAGIAIDPLSRSAARQ